MEFTFNTKEELYIRVKPALSAKLQELRRLNFKEINEDDIFNYLSINKWNKSHNLTLSDIVSDIIHADNKKLDEFVKNKKRGTV